MIEANTVLATQRLQDQLPELGYSLVGSGQYLDPTTSLWTLMAAQVGPSDAVLDALIADDVALGSAPRGVTEYELRNPLSPVRRWSEWAATDYQRVWWDADARKGAEKSVKAIIGSLQLPRRVTVIPSPFNAEHIAERLVEIQRQRSSLTAA